MLYPNNIKKKQTNNITYSNRGMDSENLINQTNEFYLVNDVALIYKKPTPIGVSKVNYTSRGKVIDKAYFKEQSTLDYNGIYKGKYIEFDVKETQNKTSFPLSNVHAHQIEHIRNVLKHGGICFLIIKINSLYFLLQGEKFIDFIKNNERKSIPYNYIEEVGFKITEKYNPPIDYLKIINNIYFKEVINNGKEN